MHAFLKLDDHLVLDRGLLLLFVFVLFLFVITQATSEISKLDEWVQCEHQKVISKEPIVFCDLENFKTKRKITSLKRDYLFLVFEKWIDLFECFFENNANIIVNKLK